MGRAIPHREGEHADQALDRLPHTPNGEALDHDLGVRVAAKRTPRRLKLRAEFGRVVDLAIVAQHEAPAVRYHRLRPGGTEVNDRKPGMTEGHAGLGIDPDAMIVGSAMAQA